MTKRRSRFVESRPESDPKRLAPDLERTTVHLRPRDRGKPRPGQTAQIDERGYETVVGMLKAAAQANSLETVFASIEQEALRVWKAAGLPHTVLKSWVRDESTGKSREIECPPEAPRLPHNRAFRSQVKDYPFTPQWYAAEILERRFVVRAFRFAGDVDNAILEGIRLGAALAEVESRSALDRRLRRDGRRGGRKRNTDRDEMLVFKARRLLEEREKVDDPVESNAELARLVRDWYNRGVTPPDSELSEGRVRNILRQHKVYPY